MTYLDLIFLDIQMDMMNGLEAAKRTREKDGKDGLFENGGSTGVWNFECAAINNQRKS